MPIRTSLTRRAPRGGAVLSAAIALLVAACEPGPVVDAPSGAAAPEPDETANLAAPPAPPEVPEARVTTGADPLETARTGNAAVAEIEPTEGNRAAGTAEFVVEDDGSIMVHARLTGLSAGLHGIHIHEFGDCSASDASSAGDHFAPDGDPHGSPYDADGEHHAGDLGNIMADESGVAEKALSDDQLSLDGDYGLVGRAIVVHSDADDLTTQPAGGSGNPVACGVIRAAESGAGAPPPA